MPYNPKSLQNLAKGHQWQPGESGNPGGRPRNPNSKAACGRKFVALKTAARLWGISGGMHKEIQAIVTGVFDLAVEKHYIPATKWLLNKAFGRVR